MTDKPNDAKTIIGYCKAATEGPWHSDVCWPHWALRDTKANDLLSTENAENNCGFCANARTDLPAVTKAAVELRWALQVAASALRARGMPSNASTMQRTLNDTAWLEDGDD